MSPRRGRSLTVRSAVLQGVLFAVVVAALPGCATGGATAELRAPGSDPTRLASPRSSPIGFAPSGPTDVARVVRITDGDTIRVVVDGVEHRLRYIGIDTPESVAPDSPVEPFAEAATAANARLVDGETVVLERDVSETDRFDRLLRYVWLEPDLGNRATDDDAWRLVNRELVLLGLAEAVDYPPDTKYSAILEAAESEARAAGRGMWTE